uniref:Uncharacterized protein n=1 Tax=Hemiselmis andersenii TaxID=464988 RepID=A0A6U2I253_HEMAN|mmetsp:Transcript_42989/g.99807  ORF Transcript_42989/g.99807 Transcript_42989/m.99807 type:complete len:161 (-) Transcript_42989:79-561(-)|eukprot:CAMPEP_0169453272 /NCGR_PEP_ID=MMETSP1042-20121227/14674_1 /TAXON_ID=464988 /ORGANISM="Hemiselmis andersenii, Strain CCMP1180" /LENGTH=160 /DNA_ID=CAMNT_0009565303 /DNA_START=14 /DNA_END=496 /DNA_ORIENTATION=-
MGMNPDVGANRRPEQTRQVAAVLGIVCLGVAAVVLSVRNADLSGRDRVLLMSRAGRAGGQQQFVGNMPVSADPARTQQLWFGPGISDELNRYVRIGKGMSPRLADNIAKGLDEQSKMVHLDSFHEGEIGHAADEADLWEGEGGNNNGGNEPCMKDPGECP